MPEPEGGQVKQDPFAALEECQKVAEDMRAKIEAQAVRIAELEAAIAAARKFIVGGK